ncbi:uncharacterized protein BO96DRAFT_437226 [Aspergillus niger CBS 101883]|uniref:uncharacterized protein n=1 Tax=Aspergillus lacticoffeatus (strain CBS 101883) TaxID=1450533 RepID=UPI000D7ECA54|nr:uncharacterized protein BO96DRAFT_437226 [Aspergillus niger CBS 101883]PYH53262.1 hypothetical protein BO96DRAFT_437226 [Aspergillus niger CBS 101883]
MASISATDKLANVRKVMTRSMTIAAASGWEWKGQYPSPMEANGIILRNHPYREQGFARFKFICYPLGPQPVSPVNVVEFEHLVQLVEERGRRIRSMKLARQSGYRDLLWDKEGCPDWERAHFDGKTDKVVTICTRYPCREIEIVFCDKSLPRLEEALNILSLKRSRCAADRPDPTYYDILSVDALSVEKINSTTDETVCRRCNIAQPTPISKRTISYIPRGPGQYYHHLSNIAQHRTCRLFSNFSVAIKIRTMNDDVVLDTCLWDDIWLPVPKLDIEPNGPLRLLNMILDPKDPCNDKKIISTHDPRIAFNTTVFELPNMDNSERLLTRGASNVQHPEIYGRGDAVSLDCFCRSLKITTVNDESILESIRTRTAEPRVSEALEDIHSNPAPLYIITGIKVAMGGTMDSVWRQWPESRARMGHGNYPEEEVKNITAAPGSKTLEVREHSDYVDFRTVVDLLQDRGRVEAPLVQTE